MIKLICTRDYNTNRALGKLPEHIIYKNGAPIKYEEGDIVEVDDKLAKELLATGSWKELE